MDLIKLLTNKINEAESSGALNEMIEKHVLKCLDDIVRESFQWSGEGKKAIESALKDKLGIEMESVKIPQYNKAISEMVSTTLINTSLENAKEQIGDVINKITGSLDKKEWKLSEIMAKYIESIDKSYDGEMEDQYGELSFYCNSSEYVDGNHFIYFDMKSEKLNYSCQNKLFISKGKLCSATLDDIPFSPFQISQSGGFDGWLFNLYCNNVTIIMDADKVQTEYYREDCD